MAYLPQLMRDALRAPLSHGSQGEHKDGSLDFSDPRDNVYAFGKMWGSYDAPAYGCFHGLMFARIGDARLKPLFGYVGTGVMQTKLLDNGHVRVRGKETGFFTDLDSGNILDRWDNPFTGERVEVFNFLNDRMRGELTLEMPRFQFGVSADEATLMNEGTLAADEKGTVPFVLPWQVFGDRVLLEWDYTHAYTNPVTPDKWPKASTGPTINPSEHFNFFTSYRELADRSVASASFEAGFSRTGPWWPWMRMGQSGIEGMVFGRMFSRKLQRGLEDIPPKVLAHVEKHHPDYLEAPTDWDDGQPRGTWEAYAEEVPPERVPPGSAPVA